MSPRLWVLAGLLSGVITGLAILAVAVLYGPEPGVARAPSSSLGPTPTAAAPSGSNALTGPAGTALAGTPASSVPPSAAATTTVMHVGQPAPSLVVPQVGGGSIDLATLRGRPVWVVFLSTSCSACIQQLSLMNTYLSRYSSSGLVVIAVAVRDDEGTVSNYANCAGVSFPFGLDLEGDAQRDWEAAGTPTHYWVDGDGIVRDAASGVIGSDRMAAGLRQVLPGVDVRP